MRELVTGVTRWQVYGYSFEVQIEMRAKPDLCRSKSNRYQRHDEAQAIVLVGGAHDGRTDRVPANTWREDWGKQGASTVTLEG